jgi:hypothetical protein
MHRAPRAGSGAEETLGLSGDRVVRNGENEDVEDGAGRGAARNPGDRNRGRRERPAERASGAPAPADCDAEGGGAFRRGGRRHLGYS